MYFIQQYNLMGNKSILGNLKLITLNTTGVYTLICEDKIHKGYNLFIDTFDDKLKLTIISLQNDKSYTTSLTLTELNKIRSHQPPITLDSAVKVFDLESNDLTYRLEEEATKLKLSFISTKNDKVCASEILLTANNPIKNDDLTLATINPLLESFISSNEIEKHLTGNSWLKINYQFI
jgi:hypothetical protein